jgi:hypothetical protein
LSVCFGERVLNPWLDRHRSLRGFPDLLLVAYQRLFRREGACCDRRGGQQPRLSILVNSCAVSFDAGAPPILAHQGIGWWWWQSQANQSLAKVPVFKALQHNPTKTPSALKILLENFVKPIV